MTKRTILTDTAIPLDWSLDLHGLVTQPCKEHEMGSVGDKLIKEIQVVSKLPYKEMYSTR